MNKFRILSIAVLIAIALNGFSQTASDSTSKHLPSKDDNNAFSQTTTDSTSKPLPSIMGGVGVLFFNGNIGKTAGISAYSTVRAGYTLGIEERPIPMIGVQLSGVIGKLSANERSDIPSDNKNFQSNIVQGDLTCYLHLLNKPGTVISPFLYTGISFMSYQRFTDSLSASGAPYYYWNDGSIRNEPQNYSDILTAKIIHRDYVYETPLGNGTTLSIPIGLGAKMHLSDNLAINVQAAYYFAFSKSIEYYTAGNGKNEKYLFSFCTIEYHFTPKPKPVSDPVYDKVDFKQIDIKDNTEKPKEITKAEEAALLAKEEQQAHDTAAVDREEVNYFKDPNSEEAKKEKQHIDSLANAPHPTTIIDPKDTTSTTATTKSYVHHILPPRLTPADYDHNGYISSQEITRAIDDFFTGTSPMTIADINALIDYFFDQDSPEDHVK